MKNLVKQYALNLSTNDVVKFAIKEGVNITNEEAILIVDTIKENIDYILSGNALDLLEQKKNLLSSEVYTHLCKLISKYSKFI